MMRHYRINWLAVATLLAIGFFVYKIGYANGYDHVLYGQEIYTIGEYYEVKIDHDIHWYK